MSPLPRLVNLCSSGCVFDKKHADYRMRKTYTIKDIAKELGLSHGTVDRVIHQRGGVSEKTQLRIQNFLNEIEFKPNVLARSLKGSRLFRLSVILPSYEKDAYWAKAAYGVEQARMEFQDFSLNIDILPYEVESSVQFKNIAQEVTENKPDGVLIAPLFYRESARFMNDCLEKSIPVVSFNTLVKKDSPMGFIGQDLWQSGRLAAELVQIKQRDDRNEFLILHIDEDPGNSVHMVEKEKGFRSYFDETHPRQGMPLVEMMKLEGDLGMKKLSVRLEKGVSGLFVTTSKVYKVARLLKERKLTHIPLVGYDLITDNISFLNEGVIDFLINQNPVQQAKLGVRSLFNFIVFNKPIPHRQLLPLDIISRQNYKSYLDVGGVDINALIFDKNTEIEKKV